MKALAFIRQHSFAKYIMADIAVAFRHLGWPVHWMDLEERVRLGSNGTGGLEGLVQGIREEVESLDPALVLSYGLEYVCEGEEVFGPGVDGTLKGLLERPSVHFFFDFDRPFDENGLAETDPALLRQIQGPGFLFFCWDREALARMHALGVQNAFYFPMAVNPAAFHRVDPSSKALQCHRTNIVFAGGPTPERIAHLEVLADLGLTIYGYGEDAWKANATLAPCWHPPVSDRETLNRRYNAARISVNVTRPHGFTSLNMRVYEAMAAGSLMLTDEKSDARELFEEDREIVLYRSPEDLRAKALWFLEHDRERQAIAEAGRQRVLREHTYDARALEAAPLIEQFYREHLLFQRIDRMAEQDAAHAFGMLRQDALADAVRLHADHYAFQLASLARRAGQPALARTYADTALEVNPGHLGSRRLLQELADGSS